MKKTNIFITALALQLFVTNFGMMIKMDNTMHHKDSHDLTWYPNLPVNFIKISKNNSYWRSRRAFLIRLDSLDSLPPVAQEDKPAVLATALLPTKTQPIINAAPPKTEIPPIHHISIPQAPPLAKTISNKVADASPKITSDTWPETSLETSEDTLDDMLPCTSTSSSPSPTNKQNKTTTKQALSTAINNTHDNKRKIDEKDAPEDTLKSPLKKQKLNTQTTTPTNDITPYLNLVNQLANACGIKQFKRTKHFLIITALKTIYMLQKKNDKLEQIITTQEELDKRKRSETSLYQTIYGQEKLELLEELARTCNIENIYPSEMVIFPQVIALINSLKEKTT